MKKTTKLLTFSGLACAIVFLFTAIIAIPISGIGYINIGDAGIMLISILFKPSIVGLISGIGSAMADLYLGYSQYALFTLIIKGIEGLVISVLLMKNNKILSYFLGSIIMVIGYFFTNLILSNNIATAIASIIPNVVQGIACIIIATISSKLFVTIKKHYF